MEEKPKILIVIPIFGEKFLTVIDSKSPLYQQYENFAKQNSIMRGSPIALFLTPAVAKEYSIKECDYDPGGINSESQVGDSNPRPRLRLNRR
jgi:hypothetical protein